MTTNPAVAVVDPTGTVNAVAPGMANISAITLDGNKTAVCVVTVTTAAPVVGNKTVTFPREVTGMNIGNLQIVIRTPNFATYTNSVVVTYIDSTVSPAVEKQETYVKDNSLTTLFNEVILIPSIITPYAVKAFTSLTFTEDLPVGAVVAVFNLDTLQDVVTYTVGGSENIPVSGVVLNKSAMSLAVGGKEMLVATVAPASATNKAVTWTSSNTSVATVSSTGEVTGVAPGTVNITVTTVDGGETATCAVTVMGGAPVPVSSVSINKYFTTIPAGSIETLVATVLPENATDKTVYWHSTNQAVAEVATLTGQVFGISAGVATITATTVDGNKTAFCGVTVTAASGTTEPAAEDKAAIQGIIDARLNLDVKKYSGLSVNVAEVDAVHATLSPMYLEYGMNAADWRTDALSPVATDEADVTNFSGTGWEFQQISPDTWLVARLGSINLKDGSSIPMADLSSFWQYSADLRALTSHTSRKLEPETHAIQLVRKENGVWKILGDQVKIFDGSIQIQFSRYGVDNSVNTGLFTFLTEDPKFPVASAVASGSFINGTVGLAKASGSNQWNNFNVGNACTYTGIAPNNPGAKIGIKVTFVDGSTQTYVFSQPDTTGMDPLSVTISADSKTFEWGSIAPQEKLREFSITFTDQATGQQLALPKFTTSDATVTQHSFSDQDLELLSGKQVWIHIHQFRNDGINRQFFTQKTFP